MTQLKKMFFVLAVAVGLGFLAISNALAAACPGGTSGVATSTSPTVRLEGTVEAIGTVKVAFLTAGVACSPGAVPSSLSISIQPSTTTVTPGSTTPNTTSTFAFPVLTGDVTGAFALAPPNISTAGNVLTFNFTPGATDTTFTISGIHANINASGLPAGSVVTATAVGGGGLSIQNNTLIVAVVNQGLSTSGAGASGFPSTPLNIASCGPAVTVSSTVAAGTTAAVGSLKGLAAATALIATIKEGFTNAWVAKAAEDGGSGAATQGTRFLVTLTGIPSGITVWVPELISAASGYVIAANGAPGNGIAAGKTLALTLVAGTVAADGSGGAFIAAPVVDQWDKLTVSGGSVTIVYEVTAGDATITPSVALPIALVGKSPTGTGTIGGSLSLAPVGSASAVAPPVNASLPQFAGGTSKTVANVAICATYLLLPWVATDAKGGIDTGVAVTNTTADPSAIGTTAQSGSCTLYLWAAAGGTNPAPVSLAPVGGTAGGALAAGQAATFVASSLGTAFSGYGIVVCNFQLGHAFAFINNPAAGATGWAEGYLALSVSNPRIPGSTGGALLTPLESAAH